MFGFKKHFKNLLVRHNIISSEYFNIFSKDLFNKRVMNELARHHFFYNAMYLINTNNISGDYVEFGSFGGMTFNLANKEKIRQKLQMKFWAFDSFEGLPNKKNKKDDHPAWNQGAMKMSESDFIKKCELNNIDKKEYRVVPGFYESTLVDQNLDLPSNISLAYIDCDFYSSTKEVLKFLLPRLKHGMIIAFDDFFMYSSDNLSGNRNAMLELFNDDIPYKLYPYMQFSHVGQSFIVEDRKLFK